MREAIDEELNSLKSLFFKNSFILADICSGNSTVYSTEIQLLNYRPISIPILLWCWQPSLSKLLNFRENINVPFFLSIEIKYSHNQAQAALVSE
jgi:hypothetical protein